MSPLESLATVLFDIGAVQFGKFKLPSGRKSRIYFDLRALVSFPEVLQTITTVYQTCLDKLDFDLLATAPLAGLPIGTALCLRMNKPLIYPRKTAKSYGTGKGIEGRWKVGQTAIIVDDLISSGETIVQTAASLKAAGLQISEAVVLIDREEGGPQLLKSQGYTLHSAISLNQLLASLENQDRITARQRTRVLKSLR